jgi:hypothetical protein
VGANPHCAAFTAGGTRESQGCQSAVGGGRGRVVIGAVAAIPAHLLPAARNLRWTWALAPTAVGAVAVWATVVEAWSVALLVGGLCSCRWAWLLERRDREAGGEARRRARQAVGVGDMLARRRDRREMRAGRLVADGGFLLGTDPRVLPVRLRFGGGSGRHGLLLRASRRPGTGRPPRPGRPVLLVEYRPTGKDSPRA